MAICGRAVTQPPGAGVPHGGNRHDSPALQKTQAVPHPRPASPIDSCMHALWVGARRHGSPLQRDTGRSREHWRDHQGRCVKRGLCLRGPIPICDR